ncbi:hypothetical protein LH464_21440 [Neorhizobium sp. T786]|uniref:hypothetical protein n=1 Tax=Pseudorhizobium xiangyangii TaxID=2883104 RepID=UPI001CFFAAF9|nr:hypothetical protein [Neorhizobium xiangyangii]MCB5205033.1 hypothetical protein [Neorhizobium xiangyangii]
MSKPVIMALDTSKTAGFAVWDTARHVTAMKTGVLEFEPDHSVEYCAGQMGLKIVRLIRENNPDFIVMESAIKTTMNGAAATIISNQLHGAVIATCTNMGVLWGTLAVQTWRAMFFGSGFKPAFKVHKLKKPDRKTGKLERIEYLWKDAAVEACERDGISLPSKKTIAHNAAEAAAMCFCWRNAIIHTDRDKLRFEELMKRRPDRKQEPGNDRPGAAA